MFLHSRDIIHTGVAQFLGLLTFYNHCMRHWLPPRLGSATNFDFRCFVFHTSALNRRVNILRQILQLLLLENDILFLLNLGMFAGVR